MLSHAPQQFAGRFHVVEVLGSGEYGDVYRVRDAPTGTELALKVLRRRDGESLVRFKREFRMLADVRHPNLVRLGEMFESEEGLFFTMEMVDGADFASAVRRDD